jgi:imidazolonepropionase-like amidohydrolase
MRTGTRRVLLGLALLAVLAAPSLATELAIHAGRILTMDGPEIENGTILIRDGKIVAVGKDLEVPPSAIVLDMKDRVVMPAWVEPHTWRMLDRSNERMPIVPYLSLVDAIDPGHLAIEQFRRDGIGTIGAFQGNSTQISARASVIKPVGIEVTRMLVRRDAGLKISLAPMRGSNRMAHTAAIRMALDAVRPTVEKRDELRKAKKDLPDLDPRTAPLVALLEGREPAFIMCPAAMDVPRALELMKTYGLKGTLILGSECHKAVDLIAKAKVPVILGPALEHVETVDGKPVVTEIAGVFHRAGVRFALSTASSTLGMSEPWFQVATAVRQGVPRDVALKAMTATAADIIGVGKRVGTIAAGKAATLVVLTGDPLSVKTWVDRLIVDGETIYERSKDERLADLLRKTPKPAKKAKPAPKPKPEKKPKPDEKPADKPKPEKVEPAPKPGDK